MPSHLAGIPLSGRFASIEPIEKGWSNDRKYQVVLDSGERLLLRLSDVGQYDKKRAEYAALGALGQVDAVLSRPLDLGLCDGGQTVYMLLTWVDGEDAEQALPKLPPSTQYALGITAGRTLRAFHSVPAPPDQPPWAERYRRKLDRKLAMYHACPLKYDDEDALLGFIERNRALIADVPQCFHHGDYHVGNMIVTPDQSIGIIDFNRFDYGDPWEEFNRIPWCAQASPDFARGRIDGYFGGRPDECFFKMMALYIAVNALSALPWALPFGQAEIDTMRAQTQMILGWYRDFKHCVPSWYAPGG